jgi:hypothetical protein
MLLPRRRAYFLSVVALALLLTGLWLLLDRWLGIPTGATRTLYSEPAFGGETRVDVVPDITLDFTVGAHAPRRNFSVWWSAVWYVERAGRYDLHLGADDRGLMRVDGEVVIERNAIAGFPTTLVTRDLTAGPHTIEVEYEQRGGRLFLNAEWAPAGGHARPFAEALLFPAAPALAQVKTSTRLRWLRDAAIAVWLVVLGFVALRLVARVRRMIAEYARGWRGVVERWPARAGPRLRTAWSWLAPLAAVLVVIAAAALRFEVICVMYGPFERPPWLFELEAHTRQPISHFRPDSFSILAVQNPYAGGDPINYLKIARGMTAFYAAHVREPIHPWTTKQFLSLLDDQDVAVSFASASFSVLAVAATYLLGTYAFSRWVGLAAAVALALERDVISWAAEGWRDDGMMAMFVLGAYVCLRVADKPTVLNAIVAGVVCGLAVLTRITTLTFLLPAIVLIASRGAWLLWRGYAPSGATAPLQAPGLDASQPPSGSGKKWPTPWAYWRAAAIVAIVMAAVAAPYIINCWRTFGDPLYSINSHTVFYRARAGLTFDQPMSVREYLGMRWRQDPTELVMTGLQGLTTYPFEIKWIGFDYWKRGIGTPLMWLSMVGMAFGLWTRNGRFLALLLLASLVPYAFTWRIQGGGEWRFTMHAYPIYLFGAALAIERLAALARQARRTEWGQLLYRVRRSTQPSSESIKRFRPGRDVRG